MNLEIGGDGCQPLESSVLQGTNLVPRFFLDSVSREGPGLIGWWL